MKLAIETIKPVSSSNNNDVICRIDLKDNLDFKNAEEFKFIVFALINGGIKKILLDINDLDEIDSMGIGAFIVIKKTLQNKNGELSVTRCNEKILALLKPTKIKDLIHFFTNIEDGVNYLKSTATGS